MQWITFVYILFIVKVYLQGRFVELGLLVQQISIHVVVVMCCQIFLLKGFTSLYSHQHV